MLEFLAPREQRAVTIDGYAVPRVEAQEVDGGRNTMITFDGRFGISIPAEYAEQVIWLVANAQAIGAGYSCHGENSQRLNPFKVRVVEIEAIDRLKE